MKKIITQISYVPVRREPAHYSEQVSQLLYGETASVLEVKSDWFYIETDFDKYKGWIEEKVTTELSREVKLKTVTNPSFFKIQSGENIFIPHGANIFYNKDKILYPGFNFTKNDIDNLCKNRELIDIGLDFWGSPYLWGGRTLFGIDCSGFSQIIFKCIGINLPRDASQQVAVGRKISSIETAIPGDLAFFENHEGKITHVGLIIQDNEILHASGSVRIDKIDQQGIFNKSSNKYTHKLCSIKRLNI